MSQVKFISYDCSYETRASVTLDITVSAFRSHSQAHNRLVADLDDYRMEVVETQSFATEVTSALEKLKEKDVRIILGNFNEAWARRIFCEAHK